MIVTVFVEHSDEEARVQLPSMALLVVFQKLRHPLVVTEHKLRAKDRLRQDWTRSQRRLRICRWSRVVSFHEENFTRSALIRCLSLVTVRFKVPWKLRRKITEVADLPCKSDVSRQKLLTFMY